MTKTKPSRAEYNTPSVKEYGSVSDLVGATFGGPGANDGGGGGYNS